MNIYITLIQIKIKKLIFYYKEKSLIALFIISNPWRSRRSFLIVILIIDPVSIPSIGWVYQMRYHCFLLINHNHCSCVVMSSAVICRTKHSNQQTSCESFEPIKHTLMSSHYMRKSIRI